MDVYAGWGADLYGCGCYLGRGEEIGVDDAGGVV